MRPLAWLTLFAVLFVAAQWFAPAAPKQPASTKEQAGLLEFDRQLKAVQANHGAVSSTLESIQAELASLDPLQSLAGTSTASAATSYASGVEDGKCVGAPLNATGIVAAVVSVTFNRKKYLQQHMDSVLAVHGLHASNRQQFPLFISQDGTPPNQEVAAYAHSLASKGVSYLHHKELKPPVPLNRKENLAYYRIANHYKFIMQTFFDCLRVPRLIILEDDMKLAPDFFGLFAATAPLLDADPSLYCVSSWNDHGQKQFVTDSTRLLRSDFFPGLGWMLTREIWQDIRPKWPAGYWDDWMRLGAVRRGRQCLRPEVCRTYNFGAVGSSKGQYFKRYLEHTALNQDPVDWAALDLSYLQPARYEQDFNATLAAAPVAEDVPAAKAASGAVKLLYDTRQQYETLTGQLGMLGEWKDGVPRGGYHRVVQVRWQAAHIFLEPSPKFRPGIDDQPIVNPRKQRRPRDSAAIRKNLIIQQQTS